MKITLNDGTTFEGTQAEYEAFLAFAERKVAEQEEQAEPEVAVKFSKGDTVKILGLSRYKANHIGQIGVVERESVIAEHVSVKVGRFSRIYNTKDIELIAKADAVITFEGAEYRKVDREAREGDVVIFTDGIFKRPYITVGKSYKVVIRDFGSTGIIDDDFDDIPVYNKTNGRNSETVDVYAPIAKSEPIAVEKPYEPKVGDIATVTISNRFSEGTIGKITEVDSDGASRLLQAGAENYANWTATENLRLATAEEIAQYEKAVADAEKPKLKAGDFVVFSEVDWCYDDITIGTPYEIYFDGEDLAFKDDVGDERVSPLNDDDCKYEILSAEEAKWAKIGRKVNEYKKGDVVRATNMIHGHTEKYGGAIGKVEDIAGDMVGIRYHNGYCGAYTTGGNVELIAPVESVLTHN